MLTTTKQMLLDAQENGYAVGAFNVENMEMLYAVIEAAAQVEAPVILQTTPSTLRYASPAMFAAMAGCAARKTSIPVALHLDHAQSLELVEEALRAGYTSVMYDGSALPVAENEQNSLLAVKKSRQYGRPVEAELGSIGGKEDSLEAAGNQYTDPKAAAAFVSSTGIDSLAVAIGTAHGFYKGEPHLDFERLEKIRENTSIPLVLHGASGVPDEMVRQAVRLGICKVNFATELRTAFTQGIREYLDGAPGAYDPKKYLGAGKDRVADLVIEKIRLCGCEGRAAPRH